MKAAAPVCQPQRMGQNEHGDENSTLGGLVGDEWNAGVFLQGVEGSVEKSEKQRRRDYAAQRSRPSNATAMPASPGPKSAC